MKTVTQEQIDANLMDYVLEVVAVKVHRVLKAKEYAERDALMRALEVQNFRDN